MSQLRFTKPSLKRQKGDFLLESLIGLVLISIVGMGEVYVSAKALVAERHMRVQEIAVGQMRAALMANKMGSIDLCADGMNITLPGTPAPIDPDAPVDPDAEPVTPTPVVVAATVNNCDYTTNVTVNAGTVLEV